MCIFVLSVCLSLSLHPHLSWRVKDRFLDVCPGGAGGGIIVASTWEAGLTMTPFFH